MQLEDILVQNSIRRYYLEGRSHENVSGMVPLTGLEDAPRDSYLFVDISEQGEPQLDFSLYNVHNYVRFGDSIEITSGSFRKGAFNPENGLLHFELQKPIHDFTKESQGRFFVNQEDIDRNRVYIIKGERQKDMYEVLGRTSIPFIEQMLQRAISPMYGSGIQETREEDLPQEIAVTALGDPIGSFKVATAYHDDRPKIEGELVGEVSIEEIPSAVEEILRADENLKQLRIARTRTEDKHPIYSIFAAETHVKLY